MKNNVPQLRINVRGQLQVLLSLLMFLAACTTAPITQRPQVMLISEQQESALGTQLYQQILRQSVLNRDVEANRIVRTIGQHIANAANKPSYSWEFAVLDDPEMVNAWVLPGGKVGVYTGLFPVAADEAGLAIILGHEAAHALAHHAGERMSQDLLLQLGTRGLAAGLGGINSQAAQQIYRAFGVGTTLGVILPFSRTQESEADRIGLILAAKAGYDPRAALAVWKRMAVIERAQPQPPEFLSTHPSYATRLENIEQWLPEALEYYEAGRHESPRKLPSLASLKPVERDEKEIITEMGRIDRLAASPGGGELIALAIARHSDQTPEQVVEVATGLSLTPGETAFVLALAEESGATPASLAAAVEKTRSWPPVAKGQGVPLARLLHRLRTVEKTARKLAEQASKSSQPPSVSQFCPEKGPPVSLLGQQPQRS